SAWMMPIFSQIGLSGPNTNGINMRTPVDNGAIYIYRLRWSYNPIPEAEIHDYKYSNYSYPEMLPGTYTPKDNLSNDYNIDRVTQRNFSYTGIRAFPTQDTALIENQWGPSPTAAWSTSAARISRSFISAAASWPRPAPWRPARSPRRRPARRATPGAAP